MEKAHAYIARHWYKLIVHLIRATNLEFYDVWPSPPCYRLNYPGITFRAIKHCRQPLLHGAVLNATVHQLLLWNTNLPAEDVIGIDNFSISTFQENSLVHAAHDRVQGVELR